MTLFHRGGDFSPLFRLLDDYDLHRSGRSDTSMRSFAPKFDVREAGDAYILDGELPGMDQKDTLVVKGRCEREYRSPEEGEATSQKAGEKEKEKEKQASKKETGPRHKYWVSERSIGEFHRSFNFPTRVDQDNVKAHLKNGVLSITVPKAGPAASKKIAIN
ncbi:hypothetical protein Egran_03533 [Elaphomyces granulatus]|uniref:SHSP domain-containing protein n=1 Tax=Elaphomyces granulatus TaxID=519963 RepID=A0A232LX94_9EURO|nr:hypothetical protein Egran_03533 [Elaphomyces granulatus]